MNDSKLLILAVIVPIVCLIGGILLGASVSAPTPLGGLVHNIQETFDAGIAVKGTEFISDARALSVTTGAFSGAITGATTLTMTGESNLDSLIFGGDVTALTATDTAQTLTAAQFCDSSLIRWDSSGTSSTLTLPTAASLIADCIPATGDTKSVLYENYGGETTTIAVASTTVEALLEPSGGDVVIATTEWALITAMTRTATTVAIMVTSVQNAD